MDEMDTGDSTSGKSRDSFFAPSKPSLGLIQPDVQFGRESDHRLDLVLGLRLHGAMTPLPHTSSLFLYRNNDCANSCF
jgi:hypothetical protein